MTKQGKHILILLMAVAAVVLLLAAPVAKQVTEGLLDTHVKNVSVFDLEYAGIALAGILVGTAWLISILMVALSRKPQGGALAKVFGLLFVAVVAVTGVFAMQYSDNDSILGFIRSEMGEVKVAPTLVVAGVLALLATVLEFCWMRKGAYEEEDVYKPLK